MAGLSITHSNITYNSITFNGKFTSTQASFDGVRGLQITMTRKASGTNTILYFPGVNGIEDGVSITTFEDIVFTGLQSENEYDCKIVLYYIAPNKDEKVFTDNTETFTFTTLAKPVVEETIGKAGSIKVTEKPSGTTFVVSYEAVTNATGYNIYCQEADFPDNIKTFIVSGGDQTTCKIGGLMANHTYNIWYCGVNGNKAGEVSATITETTIQDEVKTKGYSIYIGNGIGWDKYTAYVGTGTGWAKCYVDIGTGTAWTVE